MLNIRVPRAHKLAVAVAARHGESLTEAVIDERGIGLQSAHVKVETKLLEIIGGMINDGDKSPLEIVKLSTQRGVDPLRTVGVITDAVRAGLIRTVAVEPRETV